MSYDYIASLTLFAFAILATPGPNNIILLSTSIAYGAKKTIPNLLGIWFGFGLLIVIGTSSIGFFISESPRLLMALKFFGLAYIFYLAYKIYRSSQFDFEVEKPINFMQSTILQISNPKGLILVLAIVTNFWLDDRSYYQNLFFLVVFLISISVVSNMIWVALGLLMKKKISENILAAFNKFMVLSSDID